MFIEFLVILLASLNVVHELIVALWSIPPNLHLTLRTIYGIYSLILAFEVESMATVAAGMTMQPFWIRYEQRASLPFSNIFFTDILYLLLVKWLLTPKADC